MARISRTRHIAHIALALALGLSPTFLALSASPSKAEASAVLDLGDSQLMQYATVVVHARVLSSKTLEQGSKIATEHELEVYEWIKGEAQGSSLKIATRGGSIGNLAQVVTGEAQLQLGQEFILFLEPIRAYDNLLFPVGLSQGAIQVLTHESADGSSKKRIKRTQHNLMRSRQAMPASPSLDGLDLEDYLKSLRALSQCQSQGQPCPEE